MGEVLKSIVTIATAIIGIAILAVLVSPNAQTSNVISTLGNTFTESIAVAEAPVESGGAGTNMMNYYTPPMG